MSSLNFIGGEKGGVGKSVVARLLAQYFIDKELPFVGFDTDRSHTSFTRFYADYASPVVVDSYEGLDAIANAFETADLTGVPPRVIVDLAAQTAAPLARWIKDSELFAVLADMGIPVNFWHVADAGKDSVDLLGRLISTYETGPNYVVVKNQGRGADFSQLEASAAALHEASMRKIDRQNASFWAAVHTKSEQDSLGLLERQRVKSWLKKAYEGFDSLNL